MRRGEPGLALRHAVALGLAQGPTELLPVSSSGHTTLIPFLAGWPYAELEDEVDMAMESLGDPDDAFRYHHSYLLAVAEKR